MREVVATEPRDTRRSAPWGVAVLEWPEQAEQADALAAAGRLRLLLVAPGVQPPVAWDHTSDWIRRPARDGDMLARIENLQRRVDPASVVWIDDDGLLWRGSSWVALAPIEQRLATTLLDRIGRVVTRTELERAGWPDGVPTRALDSRLQRLRNRIAPLGLRLTNVRRRGFVLAADPISRGATLADA